MATFLLVGLSERQWWLLSSWFGSGFIANIVCLLPLFVRGIQRLALACLQAFQVSPPPTLFMGEEVKVPRPRGSALCIHLLIS